MKEAIEEKLNQEAVHPLATVPSDSIAGPKM